MTASEDELLHLAVGGDNEALATLLKRHGPGVRRQLGAIPMRWQSVLSLDDVMQETYAEAFLDIRQFDPEGEGTFAAWVSTLARRNLVDALRMLKAQKRGGDRRLADRSAGEESAVVLFEILSRSASSPTRTAARHELCGFLERAIRKLPRAQELVVRLYDLEGRRAEEIAATLNRSPGAVFMLRARAHRQLRKILGSTSQFFDDQRESPGAPSAEGHGE